MKDANGIDVDAIREKYRGRIEYAGHRRIGLYSVIQRDAMLVDKGVMPADQAHRDADLTRKPIISAMGADFLRMAGDTVPMTAAGIIERAIANDDFKLLLGDTAQKSATLGYDQAPETWPFWTTQESVNDFRQFDVITSPEFPSPSETPENGQVPTLELGSDSKESSALVSHTALFAVTRQALINNDIDGFTRVPQSMGRAANRAVGDKAYAVLIANGNMSDGNAFFSSAHGNLIASGAAPSVTTLDAARALLTAQRGPSNSILNLRPRLILAPTVLESTATTLRDAMAGTDDDSLTPGYIAGRVAVITDARLDDADATAWYVLANPKMHSGIGVYFLEGGELPLVEEVDVFSSDALNFRLIHDFCVLPTDHRSWVKNPGA
jgi:hypothetical protein